jgi:hypothetical protein
MTSCLETHTHHAAARAFLSTKTVVGLEMKSHWLIYNSMLACTTCCTCSFEACPHCMALGNRTACIR